MADEIHNGDKIDTNEADRDAEWHRKRLALPPAPADQRSEPDEGPDVLGEPATAAQRLRAFEDEHLGEDHPRYKNQVEKGHGSPFSLLPANARAHHAALENLIAVEKERADAEAHMTTVHAKLEAAVARASETEEAL